MNRTNVLWTLLAFCCLTTIVHGLCSAETMTTKVVQCFTDVGLNLNLPSGTQNSQQVIANMDSVSRDPFIYCNNLGPYKTAMGCAMDELRTCFGSNGNLLPDTDKVKAGMDYMCSKEDDINKDCLRSSTSGIQQCAAEIAQNWAQEHGSQPTMQETICTVYDITYDCSKKILGSCSEETAVITTKALNDYYLPVMCAGRPPARPRTSYSGSSFSGSSRLSALPLGALLVVVFLEIGLFLRP